MSRLLGDRFTKLDRDTLGSDSIRSQDRAHLPRLKLVIKASVKEHSPGVPKSCRNRVERTWRDQDRSCSSEKVEE